MSLHPCPSCTELVTDGTCVCPHCGEKACRRSGAHGVAVLLGLTLVAGCGGDGPGRSVQADYSAAAVSDSAEPQSIEQARKLADMLVEGGLAPETNDWAGYARAGSTLGTPVNTGDPRD